MRPSILTWLRRAASALTLGVLTACAPAEVEDRPGLNFPTGPDLNVVVVSFDALRADALGVYGYDRPTSPNIDRFAERALVFDRAYVAAPVTPTSFAAAFTGLLPHRVYRGWMLKAPITLGEAFSNHGYTTAAFLNNVQLTPERGFNAGFGDYHAFRSISDEATLDEAMGWLTAHRDERFFLWIHFLSPHSPYEYREIAAHLYDPDYEGEFEQTTTGKFDTDDPEEIERIRSLYDGEVYYADTLFEAVVESFDELGLFDDTIVVLTSDHGEEFKERGGFQHQRLNEETIRVPLMIFHPEAEEGGRTDMPFSNVDLLPTLAGLTEIPVEDSVDGQNLLERVPSARPLISEAMTDSNYRGVSVSRWPHKLILTCRPKRAFELYDLLENPTEREDLARTDGRTRAELMELLRLIYQGDPCNAIEDAVRGIPATRGLSEETIRELKALGYLQ